MGMNPLVAVLLCVGLFSAGSYLRPAFAQENGTKAYFEMNLLLNIIRKLRFEEE